jgi:hypothetical protein
MFCFLCSVVLITVMTYQFCFSELGSLICDPMVMVW